VIFFVLLVISIVEVKRWSIKKEFT